MDRRDLILKYITKEQRGIEIGPWFSPLAPKREGYNCLTLDVFDSRELRRRTEIDADFPKDLVDQIEDVDLVGSSTHIDELVARKGGLGSFDYIVSSHNFEHLPNPIRFLQGCARVLKPGGIISMAIPDKRACFDYFRPVTALSEWIEASLENRSRPTLAQKFDETWVWAHYDDTDGKKLSFHRGASPNKVSAPLNFPRAFNEWMGRWHANDKEYHDAHCSVFTPASFELLIRDSAYLGLIPFCIIDVVETQGNEFYAHLRSIGPESARPDDYERMRNALLMRIQDEAAETSWRHFEIGSELERLRLDLGEMTRRKSSLEEEIESRCAETDAANKRLSRIESELLALRLSTSWKMTAPIRFLVSALRGLVSR